MCGYVSFVKDYTTNKVYMIDFDDIVQIYRNAVELKSGRIYYFGWDEYPFLDRIFREREQYSPKIGF